MLKIWDILLNYAKSSQDCKESIRAYPDRSWQLLHIQMSRLHFSPVFCQASTTLSLLHIIIATNDSGRHWEFEVGTEVNFLHLHMWDIFLGSRVIFEKNLYARENCTNLCKHLPKQKCIFPMLHMSLNYCNILYSLECDWKEGSFWGQNWILFPGIL